jgi:hypothetical protein
MMNMDQMRILDNVGVPPALTVRITNDPAEFMNLKVQLNSGQPPLFGTAYRQGQRLHFCTAMSVNDYVRLARVDQAVRGSGVDDARGHFNRPKEASHAKAIGAYLAETACVGQPFIFPSFLVNYGIGWTEDMPTAELIIFAGQRESLAWPAIFVPPASGRLPVTDGGHRTDELKQKIEGASAGRLPENALSIVFIFESDIDAYHQDFADCAKAKAISKSMSGTWDRRDDLKRFGVDLVTTNAYLGKVIDATSNSVNLSSNAAKAWSMSALQSAVSANGVREPGVAKLSKFFDACFEKVPILVALANGGQPGQYRKQRGGCVLLRGVGLAVLTQAYLHATVTNAEPTDVAAKMSALDWFVLNDGAPEKDDGEDAYAYIAKHGQPIWRGMVAMMAGAHTFRLKGTKEAAEVSFNLVRKQFAL